jgi:hypothetical protein
MAIAIGVTQDDADGDFHVWAMLDNTEQNPDPTSRGESFIVGAGATVIDALTDAETELERAGGEIAVMLHEARLGVLPPVRRIP